MDQIGTLSTESLMNARTDGVVWARPSECKLTLEHGVVMGKEIVGHERDDIRGVIPCV